MIYLTGDTHGDFYRFSAKKFPQQRSLTRDDYVIILGDFGGVFDASPRESYFLDWLNAKPFTTLFVDGNHENFDLLDAISAREWHGGQVQEIRPNILRLCRGHIFHIDEHKFFCLGGAQSHDACVLLSCDWATSQSRRALRRGDTAFRVEGESWWRQELPDYAELQQSMSTLLWEEHPEDLIILTHCAPTSLQERLFPAYPVNALTDYLDSILRDQTYDRWFCGHYHQELTLAPERFRVLYESIIPLE